MDTETTLEKAVDADGVSRECEVDIQLQETSSEEATRAKQRRKKKKRRSASFPYLYRSCVVL